MAQPSRNPGGRPPLHQLRRRTHAVSVRFTASEAADLRRRAETSKVSIAAVVREDLARAGTAPETTASAEDVARRIELRRVGRLLNDAVRAVHRLRGNPDVETLVALRQAAGDVARELGSWS